VAKFVDEQRSRGRDGLLHRGECSVPAHQHARVHLVDGESSHGKHEGRRRPFALRQDGASGCTNAVPEALAGQSHQSCRRRRRLRGNAGAIAAALSQLRHLETHPDVAPYVSLVMLGVQALGLGIPLVAIPSSDTLNKISRVYRSIYQVVNFFSAAAFILTLWLAQKVRRAGARAGRWRTTAACTWRVLRARPRAERAGRERGAARRADTGPVPAPAGDRQRGVACQQQASCGGVLPECHRRALAAARVCLRAAATSGRVLS
jgi:hypothetical protein